MRLTRKKAIELCIELWTWCAKTGKRKEKWPEWEKYGEINCECWFCEYDQQRAKANKELWYSKCTFCLFDGGGLICEEMAYGEWDSAETTKNRKKYAKLFLEQIKALRK